MQKLRGQQSIAIDDTNNQPDALLQEWLGGGPKRGEGDASDQGQGYKYLQVHDSDNIDFQRTERTRGREHRIEIEEGQKPDDGKGCSNAHLTSFEFHSQETYPYCRSNIAIKQHEAAKPKDRRVTIHLKSRGKDLSKLIILPSSIEDLLRLAGKLFYFL